MEEVTKVVAKIHHCEDCNLAVTLIVKMESKRKFYLNDKQVVQDIVDYLFGYTLECPNISEDTKQLIETILKAYRFVKTKESRPYCDSNRI